MKITVITTTFNSASTVEDTFLSVLGQTFKDIEYLVIDGCSKDGTIDIIKAYEPKFNGRMRWVSQKDNGVYDAMNKGIRMATGDVIGFLNSDDFFTKKDCLQTIADAFGDDDIDATYGNIHYVNPDDLTLMVRFYSSKRFRPSLMRLGFMPAHPSFYCKRSVYEKLGVFDTSYKIASDFELLLRFIYVNHIRTRYIAKDFVTMRMGGLSTSGFRSHQQIMKDHRRALKANHVYSNFFILCMRYVYKSYEVIKAHITGLMVMLHRRLLKQHQSRVKRLREKIVSQK